MNELELSIIDGMIKECETLEKFWETKIDEYVKNGGECSYSNETYRVLSMRTNHAHTRKLALMDFVDAVARMGDDNTETPEELEEEEK